MVRFYQLKNGQKFKVVKNTDYAQDLVGKLLERAGDGGNVCIDEEGNTHVIAEMTFIELAKEPAKKKRSKPKEEKVEAETQPQAAVEEIIQTPEEQTPLEELLGGESS